MYARGQQRLKINAYTDPALLKLKVELNLGLTLVFLRLPRLRDYSGSLAQNVGET